VTNWPKASGEIRIGVPPTRKWASEGYNRTWPARIRTTEDAGRKAAEIWTRLKGR